MEPEIELELFAALCADVEAGRPLADVLRSEGLVESTWERSRDMWMGRMSNGPEAERKTLEERYLTAFHARKRKDRAPVHQASPPPGELEDPPTHRAPMGTVIMAPDPTPRSPTEMPADVKNADATPLSTTPPMGVTAPNPKDAAPPSATPPMGVIAPKRIDDVPPSATPPMGVSAPKPADPRLAKPQTNAELTPPMGMPAPTLADIPPPRPLRTPEPTPPMRPRSDFIPDDMARAASEAVADRKTDPPQPVPSRPALPFPAQMQPAPSVPGQPVPAPAPSAPFRSPSAAGYPAAPMASSMQYPQPPPPGATPSYGGYPATLPLTAQAIAAQGGAPSSPGYAAPPKPAGPPLALAGFTATASGPRLTLDVYAAFAAEIAVKPASVAEIRERYGFTDTAHAAEDDAWQRRFSSDRDSYVRYAKLFQHYRDWFSGRTPR
ncbi:MAG: hypothetical protein IPM54_28445 [Polyangiaceae bacterium]|nr:hypothetical protein [Polyangiaceae bacterium]